MNLLRLSRIRPQSNVKTLPDGSVIHRTMRGHHLAEELHLGPNIWHMRVLHPDHSYDDYYGQNFLTTVGRDLLAAGLGHPAGKEGAFTASSATSGTPSGGGLTTDQYKGWRVYCPVTGVTTAPVYGNIGSNSTTVLTVDQWWNAADGTATTPAATNGYFILPQTIARFMALTEDSGAGSAADTTLTGEITTGGCNRQLATYAHTPAAATYTMIKSFAVTATFPAIHRGALFSAKDTTAAGVLVFEAVLNANASVINLDTLQVTATVTLSG